MSLLLPLLPNISIPTKQPKSGPANLRTGSASEPTRLLKHQSTISSATTPTFGAASSTAPYHPPLPTVAPYPASAQRPTPSSRQAVCPTRSSVYPTASPNKPAQSANWQLKSANRREMSTSLPASPRLPSSAQPSSPTRDSPPSSPPTRSTSTTNRTPSSPSPMPPSYAGVNLERTTYGASLLYSLSATTTLTQCWSKSPPPNFSRTAHHQKKRSATCMSSRHKQN